MIETHKEKEKKMVQVNLSLQRSGSLRAQLTDVIRGTSPDFFLWAGITHQILNFITAAQCLLPREPGAQGPSFTTPPGCTEEVLGRFSVAQRGHCHARSKHSCLTWPGPHAHRQPGSGGATLIWASGAERPRREVPATKWKCSFHKKGEWRLVWRNPRYCHPVL